ncbi:MAG TPA: hypothetical protein VFP90_14685, partial [Gemmatimonadaceae bacterium]|nr:hypothetical protein [Gemmatimonadaceae bacterium]
VGRMKRNGDVMRSDRLKQVMQEIDATFDEKDLGMAKFSRFVQDAVQRGLLSATKLENGQLEIGLPSGARGEARAAETAAADEAARTDGGEPAEERKREGGRGRRGRRGRGRDREDRAPRVEHTGEHPVPAETTVAPETRAAASAEAPDLTPRTDSQPAQPAPERGRPARHERQERAPRTESAEQIGVGGERLTRDEAFDLVRRAVESLVTGDEAVRASAVRAKARDLLGRDSESLSDRNFPRILKDAHDTDVIDLRRRGDDFEVARAVEAEPVSDQLAKSAAANAPAPTAVPAAPRGMGPRGVAGPRGRGRPGAPPADLLSIGVVGPASSASAAAATSSSPRAEVAAVASAPQQSGAPAPSAEQASTPPKPRGKRAAKKATPSPSGDGAAPAAKKTTAKKTTAKKSRARKTASAGTES